MTIQRYEHDECFSCGGGRMAADVDGDYVKFSDYDKLHYAASKLRAAQKLYMKNRGDESYGVKVGVAAAELDKLINDN